MLRRTRLWCVWKVEKGKIVILSRHTKQALALKERARVMNIPSNKIDGLFLDIGKTKHIEGRVKDEHEND
jgi:hypothetical protein